MWFVVLSCQPQLVFIQWDNVILGVDIIHLPACHIYQCAKSVNLFKIWADISHNRLRLLCIILYHPCISSLYRICISSGSLEVCSQFTSGCNGLFCVTGENLHHPTSPSHLNHCQSTNHDFIADYILSHRHLSCYGQSKPTYTILSRPPYHTVTNVCSQLRWFDTILLRLRSMDCPLASVSVPHWFHLTSASCLYASTS